MLEPPFSRGWVTLRGVRAPHLARVLIGQGTLVSSPPSVSGECCCYERGRTHLRRVPVFNSLSMHPEWKFLDHVTILSLTCSHIYLYILFLSFFDVFLFPVLFQLPLTCNIKLVLRVRQNG